MVKDSKYVTYREICSITEPIKENIKEIMNNHLPHIQGRCDKIETIVNQNRLLLIITAFLAGVNILQLLGVMP